MRLVAHLRSYVGIVRLLFQLGIGPCVGIVQGVTVRVKSRERTLGNPLVSLHFVTYGEARAPLQQRRLNPMM